MFKAAIGCAAGGASWWSPVSPSRATREILDVGAAAADAIAKAKKMQKSRRDARCEREYSYLYR
jgi:hypothetical protein